jgi:hypothetical protein
VDDCDVLAAHPNRTLIRAVSVWRPGGRVMNRSAHAGFYSNLWGYLPWSWGRNEINRFEIWQVR